MVAAEGDCMLYSRLGAAAARQFAADVAAEAYELPEWTAADHAAALDVINRNSDDSNYIGIADAANVVLADRYRTTRLLLLSTSGTSGGSGRCGERTISPCCLTTREELQRFSEGTEQPWHRRPLPRDLEAARPCSKRASPLPARPVTRSGNCEEPTDPACHSLWFMALWLSEKRELSQEAVDS
jgi:hypothetical protein